MTILVGIGAFLAGLYIGWRSHVTAEQARSKITPYGNEIELYRGVKR